MWVVRGSGGELLASSLYYLASWKWGGDCEDSNDLYSVLFF